MFGLLVRKELAELRSSRSFLLLLLATSALVIHAFSTATDLYAEASGAGGGVAALQMGLIPLDGVVVPVIGVYDLVASFLLPFVVIRLFAAETASNMQPVILQLPPSWRMNVAAKGVALILAWCAAMVAGVVALIAWSAMGGHVYLPETVVVLLGHLLRGAVMIALGAAIAAFAPNPATASLSVLAVTIGTWAIDYVAAARGGVAGFIGQFTPNAALRVFERAELRVSLMLISAGLVLVGTGVAVVWMQVGLSVRARLRSLVLPAAAGIALIVAGSFINVSADLSEDRRSSFPENEEEAIRKIAGPIDISVNLAAQDPRLADFERGALAKLRRVADVDVHYVAKGRTGLFASPSDHYGEITYRMKDTTIVSRSVSESAVVEILLDAAKIPRPAVENEAGYSGFPLATSAPWWTYALQLAWPLLIIVVWFTRRTPRTFKLMET